MSKRNSPLMLVVLGMLLAANVASAQGGLEAEESAGLVTAADATTVSALRSGGSGGGSGGGKGDGKGDGKGGGKGDGKDVKGDPLIRAFDGSLFFFHGEPGKVYNFASLADGFQVAALLKEANNAAHLGLDRNGTYMEAVGFKQEAAQVSVRTYAHDSARIVVAVNGEEMDLSSEAAESSVPLKNGGAVKVAVSHFQRKEGTVVTISTPIIQVSVYLVPPGLDHAGYWQPSYLNLGFTLPTPPNGALQGVVGNTYHYSMGLTASSVDNPEKAIPVQAYSDVVYPLLPDSAYELPSLFAEPALTFPSQFLHDLIVMRKAAAFKMQPPASPLS